MRRTTIPLIASALLHVIGFALAGGAPRSLFLLFPAALYSVLSIGLWRDVRWVAWLTLACMIGGSIGTVMEFTGAPIAPVPVLIGILLADLVTAGLLVLALAQSGRITDQP